MSIATDRRAQLEARRIELNARLGRIEAELEEPLDKDAEDRATERSSDEVLEDLGAAARQEIRAIEAALLRLDDGTYGICVACGDPISEARLDVLPYAPRCGACAGAA
jgi:RNA polymerase-binding transcription factor DksA